MSRNEEGTIVSTVRGRNAEVPPIEIVERGDGGLSLHQDWDDWMEAVTIDESQLRKLWYVIGMHIEVAERMACDAKI